MTRHVKSFAKPDETRTFKGHGQIEVLPFDDRCTTGKGIFEPG